MPAARWGAGPDVADKVRSGELHVRQAVQLIHHFQRAGQGVAEDLLFRHVVPQGEEQDDGNHVEEVLVGNELVKAERFAVFGVVDGFVGDRTGHAVYLLMPASSFFSIWSMMKPMTAPDRPTQIMPRTMMSGRPRRPPIVMRKPRPESAASSSAATRLVQQ